MTSILDYLFHLKFYQNTTQKGPFKLPGGKEGIIDIGTQGAKKVFEYGASFFSSQNNEDLTAKVRDFHVPGQRNWTRAINGVLQGVVMLIVSIMLKKNLRFPLMLVSISWSTAGIRHLMAAGYNNNLTEDYWSKTKMFWQ
jgi:hypothetical protein